MESVSTFFSYLLNNLKAIRFTDVLDILLMAFIIYKGVELVRKTHSTRLAKGILFLVLMLWLYLSSTILIMGNVFNQIMNETRQKYGSWKPPLPKE